jgi:hypothetical protein
MEDINTMTATLVLLLFLAERVRERERWLHAMWVS